MVWETGVGSSRPRHPLSQLTKLQTNRQSALKGTSACKQGGYRRRTSIRMAGALAEIRNQHLPSRNQKRYRFRKLNPVVLYGCGTRSWLKRTNAEILWGSCIYWPVTEQEVRGMQTNRELKDLYTTPDLVAGIKRRTMGWLGTCD